MKSINPTTGETIRDWPQLSDEQLQERLRMAATRFREWRNTPIAERTGALTRLAGVLRSRQNELAELMVQEMGKPVSQAKSEVAKCAYVCDYYAEHAPSFLSPQRVQLQRMRSYIRFDPIGIVLAVMPWNFPFWQVFRQAAPAVAAGNVVLLKHAANVPGCAQAIEDLFDEAGFATGIFTTLLISHAQVPWVIEQAGVQAISLTGSERAAEEVAANAARKLKKSVLELGGSDPFIVLADADLERTVEQAVKARTMNSGQSCIAAKRFLVVEAIADRFCEMFVDQMQSLKVGDPTNPDIDIGPLARPDILETLHAQVERSVQAGARLLCGGQPREGKGSFYPPTVLVDVEPGMAVFDEETFGPVAAICQVRNEDEAIIELANQTSFGLGASIWTEDITRAERIAAQLQCGSVFVNEIVQSDPHLPFGGVKRSGYGRELSDFGIREFTNIKTIGIRQSDAVQEASEESFPASDPPAWTPVSSP